MFLLLAAILSATTQSRIDAIVTQVMQREHIAGLSLGVARRGAPLYVRGYGERDVARHLDADGYTVYAIGSLTKQFTAALVLQQTARGGIALDAPLQRYLPQITPPAGAVTIAQLLGQTSGIVSYTERSRAEIASLAAENPPPERVWQLVAGEPLAFPPGAQWQYSNTNYLLLGMTLQSVTGLPYSQLLDRNVVSPLRLESTTYGLPAFAQNVARAYAWRGGFESVPMSQGIFDVAFSAGGVTSNAPDLLTWLEGLRSGTIVSPAAFAAMATSGRLNDNVASNYGFGFFIDNWYGYRVIDHSGNIDGFSSADAIVLDDGLEITVLSNADGIDLEPLSKSIVALIDAPRDANLVARIGTPAENENPHITAAIRTILDTPPFAVLGKLQSIEFVERSIRAGVTYDKYRLTFAAGQWWLTFGYRRDDTIESLMLAPDTP